MPVDPRPLPGSGAAPDGWAPGRDDLLARVTAQLESGRRVILGIAGCPGAGKSTLAEWLVDRVDPARVRSAWIPMDGFHLADHELTRLGLLEQKGSISTFDGYGYLATLRRIRRERGNTVYAPHFDRLLEQPVAGSVPVLPAAQLIVTEGNYLLDDGAPWPLIRAELDEVWYVEVDDELRRQRLVDRHVRFGKSPQDAREWVQGVDEVNAQRIRLGRPRADLVVASA